MGRGLGDAAAVGDARPDHRAALGNPGGWHFRLDFRPPGGADRQAGGEDHRRPSPGRGEGEGVLTNSDTLSPFSSGGVVSARGNTTPEPFMTPQDADKAA